MLFAIRLFLLYTIINLTYFFQRDLYTNLLFMKKAVADVKISNDNSLNGGMGEWKCRRRQMA